MPDLSIQKKAQRLRIYIGESDRWRGKPLESALLETLRAQGMAGATVFRAAAGFGAHSRIHTASIEVLSFDLPVVIEAVDTEEKIASVLEVVAPMVREGLITLEAVQIVQYTHRFLNPLPADKLVAEVMTRDVVALSPQMPVFAAWKRMLENGIKAMPVIDAERRVVGILTDEDLLERGGIQQRLSIALRMDKAEIEQELRALERSPITVAQIMSQPVITTAETAPLGAATRQMVKAGLKRLPVVDEEGQLVGMLSRLDILGQVAQTEQPAHAREPLHPQAVRLVKDVMTSDIPMVQQEDDLAAIIAKFAQSSSHRLIVVDDAGKAIGLLSDSDVVTKVQPASRKSILQALRQIGRPAPGTETALDLMSPGPLTAPPDLPVVEAVRRILAERRKWLVVVDEAGKPLGLVDRQILLRAVTGL